jgi:large subunit ribosomal protein L3
MGGQQNTVQNLKVLQTDPENGLVVVNGECRIPERISLQHDANYVLGAVSGPKGTLVFIQDALKKAWPTVPDSPEPVAIDIELNKPVDAKIPA